MDDKKLVCKADYEAARARGEHCVSPVCYIEFAEVFFV